MSGVSVNDRPRGAALAAVRHRWWLLLAVPGLFAAVAAAVSLVLPPVYSATARVVVGTTSRQNPTFENVQADEAYARTYAQLMGSTTLAKRVVSRLSFSSTPAAAGQAMSFTAHNDTPLIEVSAQAGSARQAAELANTWAATFVSDGPALLAVQPRSVKVADPAATPSAPVRPRPKLYVGIAALVGLVIGAAMASSQRQPQPGAPLGGTATLASVPAGAAALTPLSAGPFAGERSATHMLALLHHRWRPMVAAAVVGALLGALSFAAAALPAPWGGGATSRAVAGLVAGAVVALLAGLVVLYGYARVRQPVLLVSDVARAAATGLVVQVRKPRRAWQREADVRSRDLEPYRVLYAGLTGPSMPRTVLVVGTGADAQASVTAIDFALVCAAATVPTVLVGTSPHSGLVNTGGLLLRTAADPSAVDAELVPTDRPHLKVLPMTWPSAADTIGRAALGSEALRMLVDQLLTRADIVVLAGPSFGDTASMLRLADVSDGALLVVPAGSATLPECASATSALERARCPVLGVALTHRVRRMLGRQVLVTPAGTPPHPPTGGDPANRPGDPAGQLGDPAGRGSPLSRSRTRPEQAAQPRAEPGRSLAVEHRDVYVIPNHSRFHNMFCLPNPESTVDLGGWGAVVGRLWRRLLM